MKRERSRGRGRGRGRVFATQFVNRQDKRTITRTSQTLSKAKRTIMKSANKRWDDKKRRSTDGARSFRFISLCTPFSLSSVTPPAAAHNAKMQLTLLKCATLVQLFVVHLSLPQAVPASLLLLLPAPKTFLLCRQLRHGRRLRLQPDWPFSCPFRGRVKRLRSSRVQDLKCISRGGVREQSGQCGLTWTLQQPLFNLATLYAGGTNLKVRSG